MTNGYGVGAFKVIPTAFRMLKALEPASPVAPPNITDYVGNVRVTCSVELCCTNATVRCIVRCSHTGSAVEVIVPQYSIAESKRAGLSKMV